MFASSRTIPAPFPDKVAFSGHVAFKQLQVHSFYIVYALSTSYIHWPVVSDHFAPCFDHFPSQFALFLPCMSSPQTSKKKVFFGHEKKPFQLQHRMFRSSEPHNYYIDRTSQTFLKQKRWMVKVYQHYHEFLVRIRRKAGKRPEGQLHKNRERGVREPQRLGMSQGTMNREPKYGGGAHPKYGSCRGLVSPIPRAGISRCPYEVPVVRRRRS